MHNEATMPISRVAEGYEELAEQIRQLQATGEHVTLGDIAAVADGLAAALRAQAVATVLEEPPLGVRAILANLIEMRAMLPTGSGEEPSPFVVRLDFAISEIHKLTN